VPYIPKASREHFSAALDAVRATPPACSGEMNYLLTRLCQIYLARYREIFGRVDYEGRAEVVSALECCKLEFYRRNLAPYEDTKIKENGDVL